MNINSINEMYKSNMKNAETGNPLNLANGLSCNYANVGISTGHVNKAYVEEVTFSKGENMADPYDRVSNSKDGMKNNVVGENAENMLFSKEMLDKLGQVVGADNFDMYEEFGLAPDKDDPTNILTISERIDIELATYCEDYKPVTDVSMADLKGIYGDTGRAYAVAAELYDTNSSLVNGSMAEENIREIVKAMDKIDSIKEYSINSDATEYLLVNNLPITIDNVYKAIHSVNGNGGYEKISSADWNALEPQAKEMLDMNGIEISTETMSDAKWLVDNKIPLTAENVYKMSQIRDINERFTQGITNDSGWISKISEDMLITGSAGSVSLDYYSNISMDSIEVQTILENGTEDQVETLVMDGKEVNLLNLMKVQENSVRDAQTEQKKEYFKKQFEDAKNYDADKQRKIISSQRALEEARLKMTVESAAVLIKNGINIDITPIEEIVEELRGIENSLAQTVFSALDYKPTAEEINLFLDSNRVLADFSVAPAYVLGESYVGDITYTVSDISERGMVRADILRNMNESYDALGTKPDRNFGDSLKAAFNGIDDILKSLNMDSGVINERAVRILAYNQIEINYQTVNDIKKMDAEVSRLIDNMTPRTVAYMISNGINPLKTNISELNDYLDKLNEKIDPWGVESYSEYLYKLDKKGEISKEDRDSYIGIYKIINMIEKGDRRAVGAVVKAGEELTMRNLMTAARSLGRKNREVTVDDELGLSEQTRIGDNNLDVLLKKIESSPELKIVNEKLSPEYIDLKGLENGETEGNIFDEKIDSFLEKMYEQIMSNSNGEDKKAFLGDKAKEISDLQYVSEEVFENILEDNVPVNMTNVLGLSYLFSGNKNIYDRIKEEISDEDVSNDIENILDDEGMIDRLNEDVRNALLEKSTIKAMDVRQIYGAMNYIKRATDEKSYYVPVTFENENRLVKFTIKNEDEENKKGDISVKVYNGDETIKANISLRDGRFVIRDINENISGSEKISDINLKIDKMFSDISENELGDTKILFKVAKEFINEFIKIS